MLPIKVIICCKNFIKNRQLKHCEFSEVYWGETHFNLLSDAEDLYLDLWLDLRVL